MSSDSEEDNIAEKLKKLTNKYRDDKIDNKNLLEQSSEFDDSGRFDQSAGGGSSSFIDNEVPGPSRGRGKRAAPKKEEKKEEKSDKLDESLAKRRRTRASKKQESGSEESLSDILPDPTPSRRGRKKRTCARTSTNTGNGNLEDFGFGSIVQPQRGRRGRRRGRHNTTPPRGRGRQNTRWRRGGWFWSSRDNAVDAYRELMEQFMDTVHTYAIGDADEVNDKSAGQALFGQKPETATNEQTVVVEDELEDNDNEELSVKVEWQSTEIEKFTIRKYQKLTPIYEFFAKKHNVAHDKLLFQYNDKVIKSSDTPDSIEYKEVKFIKGGIISQSVNLDDVEKENIKNGVKLKFQCANLKKPFEITVSLDDRLSVAMMKCAEQLEKPLSSLKFEFDGDVISGKTSAREMELEGGECIDVKLLS